MVRVLQVVTSMEKGGIENMLMNFYRKIDRTKVQFNFLIHDPKRADFEDEIEEMGGRIYRTPERNIKNSETKAILAKKAAQFVKNNDVIYIDTGSTTVGIIDNLADKKNVTVITNSVSVIIKALNLDNIRLIAIPGLLDRKVAALIGPQAVESLKNYNINKAFLTCTAFSIKGGVMNSTPEEYTIKQTAMSNSMEVYLLADKDKFGKHSLMTYAQIGDFDYFITDMQKNAKFSKYLAEHRTKLIPI